MAFEKSALIAAKNTLEKHSLPKDAWADAVQIEFPHSISSQHKGCPKNTFLGLCEAGKIKDIKSGNYTGSNLNKQYALTAIKILAANKGKSFTPSELWQSVLNKVGADINKRHNSQMNVVLALWENGLIEL